MNYPTIAALGLDRVISLARQNKLSNKFLWSAIRGGWRYISAVAAGDITSEEVAAHRVSVCKECKACDDVQTKLPNVIAHYCGSGETIDGEPTCGCLVSITVKGYPTQSAGKTSVATEHCPRSRW